MLEMHFEGQISVSTLRQSLASVLFAALDIRRVGAHKLSRDSEDRITEWMLLHLSFSVYPFHNRDGLLDLERQLRLRLAPPLNVTGVPPSEILRRMKQLRASLRRG